MCVCMCVSVSERETERKKVIDRERGGDREREIVTHHSYVLHPSLVNIAQIYQEWNDRSTQIY